MSDEVRTTLATFGLVAGVIIFVDAIVTPGYQPWQSMFSGLLIAVNIVTLVSKDD